VTHVEVGVINQPKVGGKHENKRIKMHVKAARGEEGAGNGEKKKKKRRNSRRGGKKKKPEIKEKNKQRQHK